MKKLNLLYAVLISGIMVFSSCKTTEEDTSVRSIALNKTEISLLPGAEEKLNYEIFPNNAVNKSVTWKSSDSTVAKVSSTGLVTAVKPGNAVITVTTVENNFTATCAVSVSLNAPISVSGEVEGVWKKYSVISVTGQINVPKGKTLTIEEGVEVIVSDAAMDANGTKIEFLVNGSLYVKGKVGAPVLISVAPSKRTAENTFARLWGGIVGGLECSEMVLEYATIEYTGAITTLTSPSVVDGLFKPAGGDGMVAFNTNNPLGKYVIQNCIFRFTGEDAIYVQGGECIFTNNLFYANGQTGGEAINVKAGCKVDAAFNIMYSPNTNALKLSSSGQSVTRAQALIKGYNNTIINSGWRRDPNKPKGGCVWLEEGCLVEIYNNLIVNSMFAVRLDSKKLPDDNSKVDYNFYTSGTSKSTIPQHVTNGTETAYDGFKPGVKDVVMGPNDKVGTAPGNNDPKFVNFPFLTNSPLEFGNFSNAWDFSLQAGSPALTGAKTDFTPYFAAGLTVGGIVYKSPSPAAYFGAKGLK